MEWIPSKDKSKIKARCIYCKATLSAASSSGTSHLLRHKNKCPSRFTKDLKNYCIEVDNKVGNDEKLDMRLKTPSVCAKELRRAICMYVVAGAHPFSTIEEPGFRYMMSVAYPHFSVISRHTLRRDVAKHFMDEHKLLGDEFEKVLGRICFTSDNWLNDSKDDEYICITAHWIDKNWKLQKRIIQFGELTPPFDGVNIDDDIFMCLSNWKIDRKLFTFTLDNASYNDTMVSHLKARYLRNGSMMLHGEFFHIRCCCHIINLIVQAGIKKIDDVVWKIRAIVEHLKAFIPKKKKFYDLAQRTYHLEIMKRLRGDSCVRWNSTYLMLERAIYFKDVLDHFISRDGDLRMFSLSEDEWGKLTNIHSFFKVFYDATARFSASKYPNANIFFIGMWEIQKILIDTTNRVVDFLSVMVEEIQKKFDKYWTNYNLVLACAIVFYPRFKLDYVEYCYTKIYGDVFAKEKVKTILEILTKILRSYSIQMLKIKDLEVRDVVVTIKTKGMI